MPLGDRTGPSGKGPKTGRGLGYGGGYDKPGYKSSRPRKMVINKKTGKKGYWVSIGGHPVFMAAKFAAGSAATIAGTTLVGRKIGKKVGGIVGAIKGDQLSRKLASGVSGQLRNNKTYRNALASIVTYLKMSGRKAPRALKYIKTPNKTLPKTGAILGRRLGKNVGRNVGTKAGFAAGAIGVGGYALGRLVKRRKKEY